MKLALLIATIGFLSVTLFAPIYPHEQTLQHVPTVIALALLGVDVRRNRLSIGAFACCVAFLWLHILGARYIYSFVPYDDWSQAYVGGSPKTWFGWTRNHYDRFVHFGFGALAMLPAFQVARRFAGTNRAWSIVFALLTVATVGAAYEVFEWLLTVVVSPHDAESYNGQQGDVWDPQKDMTAAQVGAILATPPVWWSDRRP
jgi:putative membrane protein